jgi:hypothetical protein
MRSEYAAALLSVLMVAPLSADPLWEIDLPADIEWVQVTDESTDSGHLREWIPVGTEPETSYWIISDQRIPVPRSANAQAFARALMNAARESCTHTLYNGPEKLRLGDHDTVVVRTMCAHRNGTAHGAFIDQRILVEGSTANVMTSELRTAPTRRAGALEFGPETAPSEIMEFMNRTEKSAALVRSGITLQR